MRHLVVWMRFGEPVAHHGQRGIFALASLRLVDLFTAGWEVAPAVSEVALGGDLVVVERPVGVFKDRHADLRAVASTDDRLVGLLGESPRRV